MLFRPYVIIVCRILSIEIAGLELFTTWMRKVRVFYFHKFHTSSPSNHDDNKALESD